jgi:cytochrome c biogenesis protein CcdA
MDFGLLRYGLGFSAGLLSTLSPCVLPILPVLIGSALSAHRRAPFALALGLALSYAIIGTLLARAGAAIPLSGEWAHRFVAGLLAVFGLLLLSAPLARSFSQASAGLADIGNRLSDRWHLDGLLGQFVIGLLLGIVWSPCVGPTLGAAIVLAGQGNQLAQSALLMALFGLGAALPIPLLALLSRAMIQRRRHALLRIGQSGKQWLGVGLLAAALLILSGADHLLESWLLDHSPLWLTTLTTRF